MINLNLVNVLWTVVNIVLWIISFDDGARLEIMNKPGMVDADKHLNRIRRIIA